MRELFTVDESVTFCKALSSKLRVAMLQYIYKNKDTGLNDLAEQFNVSRAAVTQNIKILIDADMVDLKSVSGKRGLRKVCFIKENKFVITLGNHFDSENMYQTEMPIGQYTDYQIYPTCGIATTQALIGVVDDPRYFDAPSRTDAGILWMRKGSVEYRLPNYLEENQYPTEIQISMELSSEAPGVSEKWPSDIFFYFNDTKLGFWTSPGDFGDVRGMYTPEWWFANWNQYGLLKLLSINEQGTFIDGLMISTVTIDELKLNYKSDFKLKLAVPDEAVNIGGMTIFGKGFGNYNQDIKVRVIYKAVGEETN